MTLRLFTMVSAAGGLSGRLWPLMLIVSGRTDAVLFVYFCLKQVLSSKWMKTPVSRCGVAREMHGYRRLPKVAWTCAREEA